MLSFSFSSDVTVTKKETVKNSRILSATERNANNFIISNVQSVATKVQGATLSKDEKEKRLEFYKKLRTLVIDGTQEDTQQKGLKGVISLLMFARVAEFLEYSKKQASTTEKVDFHRFVVGIDEVDKFLFLLKDSPLNEESLYTFFSSLGIEKEKVVILSPSFLDKELQKVFINVTTKEQRESLYYLSAIFNIIKFSRFLISNVNLATKQGIDARRTYFNNLLESVTAKEKQLQEVSNDEEQATTKELTA